MRLDSKYQVYREKIRGSNNKKGKRGKKISCEIIDRYLVNEHSTGKAQRDVVKYEITRWGESYMAVIGNGGARTSDHTFVQYS